MGSLQWLLDLTLAGLLAITLVQALRLHRALAALQNGQAPLADIVQKFEDGTREAQAGIDRLREAADGAGRTLARQSQAAGGLSQDLAYLIERAEALADRLEQAVRVAARSAEAASGAPRSQTVAPRAAPPRAAPPRQPGSATEPAAEEPARPRSRAERDLLAALRLAR